MRANLTHILQRSNAIRPDATALIDGDRRLSWRELAHRSAALASALRGLGLAADDRVAVLAENGHRYVELLMGVAWAGGIVVPLNFRLAATELRAVLDDAAATFLFASDTFIDLAHDLGRESTTIRHVVPMTPSARRGHHDDLIESARPSERALRSDDDIFALYYTSGTSGLPKGVMLTHGNFFTSALAAVPHIAVTERSVSLIPSPLFHVAGMSLLVPTLLTGGCAVLLPRFAADTTVEAIQRHRPTNAVLISAVLEFLLNDPDAAKVDVSSLRTIQFGASAMPASVLEKMFGLFAGKRLIHSYGLTEATSMASAIDFNSVPPGDPRRGGSCVGPAIPGVDVMLRPLGDGPSGQRDAGEILVHGPTVMKGYWNKPDATAEALRDGWLHTGDIGSLDEAGNLFIIDRLKDMIITGGENVYSTEVERAVESYAGVRRCVAIGLPDPKWGETIAAVILPEDGAVIDGTALDRHCRERLAGFKCPRRIYYRDTPFPVNSAGKILKAKLRAEYL